MKVISINLVKFLSVSAILPLLWSCGDAAPETSLTKMNNGKLVQTYDLAPKSTVGVFSADHSCTGVIVNSTHVLTAAHCEPTVVRGLVKFYNGANLSGETRNVIRVTMRPGVNPFVRPQKLNDSSGKFADIAVLELNAPIPAGYSPAELPIAGYPGNEKTGWLVGRGLHDGRDNLTDLLKWLESKTYSSNTNDGHFLVNSSDTNDGDSGGPFYTLNSATNRLIVHGVLFGNVFEWAWHSKYTSITHHMNWILQAMRTPLESSKTLSTRVAYWVDTNPSWPGIYYAKGQGSCDAGEARGNQNCEKLSLPNLVYGVAYWVDTNPSWPGVYYAKVNSACPHGGAGDGANCQLVRFRASF